MEDTSPPENVDLSNTFFRDIVENSSEGVVSIDTRGQIRYCNAAVTRILGYDADELIGRPITEIIPERYREKHLDAFQTYLETGERTLDWQGTQFSAVHRDGSEVPIILSFYEHNHSDEQLFTGLLRDISEQVKYEQQLESQRDNLQILNQVVRHDIRNDLQLVMAYAEVLGGCVMDGSDEYRQRILEATRSAVDTTMTARDVTEVMLHSDGDTRPVFFRSTLECEVDDVRSSQEQAVITIEGSIPDVRVRADDLLESVFRNLLTNAIFHNDKEVPEVAVSATADDEAVRVRVADNGPGIPDDQTEQIFEEGKTGLDSAGTGLGLYLVQTLVDRYDGTIRVEDNEPEGSVFVVELRRCE